MRKLTLRYLILAVAVAVTLAVGVLAFLYFRFGREPAPSSDSGRGIAAYTLGEWEGQLAVFAGEDAFPQKLYDVAVAALPQGEQERLKNGIAVADDEELQRLLEDYTS